MNSRIAILSMQQILINSNEVGNANEICISSLVSIKKKKKKYFKMNENRFDIL